jgi:hypothetical protein
MPPRQQAKEKICSTWGLRRARKKVGAISEFPTKGYPPNISGMLLWAELPESGLEDTQA